MATYKEIKGVTLQTQDEDPVVNAGSWASGGDMNTARSAKQSSGTGSDNAIVAGGYLATASPARQTACEVYNGTAWTEVAEANTARMFGQGGGTSTAAIISGGDTTATPPYQGITETWNGSAWTEVNDMNTGRVGHFLTGVTTAAIVGGAYPASTSVESWDGSSWTEASYDLNTAKTYMWGAGTSTAAIVSGQPNTVEQFNGSNWTEVAETNTDHREGGSGGISTDALVWGGEPGYTVNTELWDNSSWTEQSNLSTGRSYVGATENAPSTTTALAYGGSSPAQVASTEEWGFPPATQAKLKEGMIFLSGGTTLKGFGKAAAVPTGTWSSGGTMNTSREQGADFGSSTAGVAAGGGGSSTNTEEYNGTSWAEVNDIPAAGAAGGATGPQTSGLIFGFKQSSPVRVDTMTYDGTNFTEVNNLNTGRNVGGSAGGSQTSALYAGGSSSIDNTEIWNGTTWTEVADLNDGRYFLKGGGTTTAAVLAGGYGGSPSTNPAQSEQWNGTSWTEGNDLNTGRAFLTGGGSSYTSAIVFGGGPFPSPGVTEKTETWNGTSWTEQSDMATKSETSHGTTQGTAVGTYRARTPAGGATEEWSVDSALSTLDFD